MKLVTFMISQCVLLCTVSFHRCILKPKNFPYNVRHFTSIIHAYSLDTVQSINTITFYVQRFLFLNRGSIHKISLLFLALPLQEQLIHFSSLEFFYLKRGKSYFFQLFHQKRIDCLPASETLVDSAGAQIRNLSRLCRVSISIFILFYFIAFADCLSAIMAMDTHRDISSSTFSTDV